MRIQACLFSILFLISQSISAALVELDWEGAAAGNNYLTLDTGTGYEWLDLTVTAGMSYNQVLAETQMGGQFDGFQIADYLEVESFFLFFSEYAVVSPTDMTLQESLANVKIFQSYIGVTGTQFCSAPDNCTYFSAGMTNRKIYDPLLQLEVSYSYSDTPLDWAYGFLSSSDADSVDPSIGTYVYRVSEVPVPAAVWLFVSGLLGLIGSAKRKH